MPVGSTRAARHARPATAVAPAATTTMAPAMATRRTPPAPAAHVRPTPTVQSLSGIPILTLRCHLQACVINRDCRDRRHTPPSCSPPTPTQLAAAAAVHCTVAPPQSLECCLRLSACLRLPRARWPDAARAHARTLFCARDCVPACCAGTSHRRRAAPCAPVLSLHHRSLPPSPAIHLQSATVVCPPPPPHHHDAA